MAADELLSVGIIPVLLIFFIIAFLWNRSRRPSDLPPGPVPLPVLGNLLYLLAGDLRKVSESLRKKYGSLFSLSLGPHWVIVVNGIDTLKDVFVKKEAYFSDRPDVYFFTHIKARKGLAAAPTWKEQRAFTLNLLRGFGFGKRSMESTIANEFKHFVNVVAKEQGSPVCINGLINKAVANVICSIVIGKRFEYDDEKFHNFVFAITETAINKYIPMVNLFPFLRLVPGDVFRIQQCTDQNQMVREGIQKYIDEHNASLNEGDVRDFIDAYLLEIKHHRHEKNTPFTEDNLKYVVLDLLSAGTETTTTTIQWVVLFLANHPEVQENIRIELTENTSADCPPQLSETSHFPYCEAVIAESQRLGNISPMSLPHTASDDVKVGGYRIPKGAVVIPNLDSVMHDETIFPDSYKFDPTRFLDEEGNLQGLEKILPFSLGKRVCPGQALAKMELFLFITSIVHRFKILPPINEEPPPAVGSLGVLHEPEPFHVRFIER